MIEMNNSGGISSGASKLTGGDWFGLLGSAIDAGSQIGTALINKKSVEKTNAANQQMVQDTNALNYKIANETNAMNAAINQANIASQERENAITREREDNAVQRRANDLIRAGLSKTLAAGDAASANALQAPEAKIAMEKAHAMQAAKNQAWQMNLNTDFGTAMRHAREMQVADRELDLKEDALSIQREELEESKRHNQAVESENERYHDLMNDWEKAKSDQNDRFHSDALKLDWAEHELRNLEYLTDKDYKQMQNAWYKFQIYSGNKKLTAELAEMAAKTASYWSGVKLDDAQRKLINRQCKYVAEETANILIQRGLLKDQHKIYFIDAMTKLYNLATASSEGTTTSGHVVSESEATENSRDRKSSILSRAVGTGLSVGAAIFVGAGGGKMLQKALGWDDHNPGPWY